MPDEDAKKVLLAIACACGTLMLTAMALFYMITPELRSETKTPAAVYDYASLTVDTKELDTIVKQMQADIRHQRMPSGAALEHRLTYFKQAAQQARHGAPVPANVNEVIQHGDAALSAIRRQDMLLTQQSVIALDNAVGDVLFTIDHSPTK